MPFPSLSLSLGLSVSVSPLPNRTPASFCPRSPHTPHCSGSGDRPRWTSRTDGSRPAPEAGGGRGPLFLHRAVFCPEGAMAGRIFVRSDIDTSLSCTCVRCFFLGAEGVVLACGSCELGLAPRFALAPTRSPLAHSHTRLPSRLGPLQIRTAAHRTTLFPVFANNVPRGSAPQQHIAHARAVVFAIARTYLAVGWGRRGRSVGGSACVGEGLGPIPPFGGMCHLPPHRSVAPLCTYQARHDCTIALYILQRATYPAGRPPANSTSVHAGVRANARLT
ncbi:hypothetical protein CALCODRAFT_357771 [Calocera cornea HHB12733]|uniref:Uncharacterized protein n=1 Tax=Calocera cornea HHB12733 TaxID=1353952 RepID=A0A165EPH6_9BASI|nr:hypothetical protein CALCODRAFT_357771 [Calocera cornea HHB12733]